jgi:hypothetical protein
MALLPKKLRFWLFDTLSLKTMRYVHAVPRHRAKGLVAEVYDQIAEDFFINGSLSSRSKVPNLLAAIWTAGRETILVSDKLDRTTKEAMTATISVINDCPYCGDMLVSLVHAGDRPEDAVQILENKEEDISDPVLRDRLAWVKAVATPGSPPLVSTPFTEQELPEAIGSLMAMSDVNRFSHIVMDGSPVNAPFGIQRIKQIALGIFGNELRATHIHPLEPGRTLHLLPKADLPDDMQWAKTSPRIAQALAQWAAAVERETEGVIPQNVKQLVHDHLGRWQGDLMPMSRSWVEQEVGDLKGEERAIARFALVLAKASYQIDEKLIEEVLGEEGDEERFICILAWCSFTASRYIGRRIANLAVPRSNKLGQAA